jgi:hypothetical protein
MPINTVDSIERLNNNTGPWLPDGYYYDPHKDSSWHRNCYKPDSIKSLVQLLDEWQIKKDGVYEGIDRGVLPYVEYKGKRYSYEKHTGHGDVSVTIPSLGLMIQVSRQFVDSKSYNLEEFIHHEVIKYVDAEEYRKASVSIHRDACCAMSNFLNFMNTLDSTTVRFMMIEAA